MMDKLDRSTFDEDVLKEIKKLRAELAEFREEMRDTLIDFRTAIREYTNTSDPYYL